MIRPWCMLVLRTGVAKAESFTICVARLVSWKEPTKDRKIHNKGPNKGQEGSNKGLVEGQVGLNKAANVGPNKGSNEGSTTSSAWHTCFSLGSATTENTLAWLAKPLEMGK